MQRQTEAEEIRAQREPTGTLPELFTKGNGTQTLNPEPVLGHWDYEETMTHGWCQECMSTNVNQPRRWLSNKRKRLAYFEKYSIWV